MVRPTAVFSLILTSVFVPANANCLYGTSLLPRQVESGRATVSSFEYNGEKGPIGWAGLSPDNSACHLGRNQSPIALNGSIPEASSPVNVSFPTVDEAVIENIGSTLDVVVNGTTTFEGKSYAHQQFHFHTPSEHHIEGEYFPLEMHMVHEASDGSFLVLGLLFELTEDASTTDLLSSVIERLDEASEPGAVSSTGPLDFTELSSVMQTKPLFQYSGSLTTPPCREGINFLIAKEPLPLNVKTYKALKKVMGFNARYVQNTLGSINLLEMAASQFGCAVNSSSGY
ncbi:carbonic anhydrase [Moniliophthora roreri MCA 2997]|uniref:Carbonic anhydrase n=2 Tax=Moniliophthora roreri TaxID=221103 RepID=V2Y8L3_MONRO|nr:carbonic anhydrase [Moniliophthora roreri MCA 2997]KAI3621299.1 carbonic anhydrase [Moniliophthora roreri]